jgi:hypothetical protein
MSKASKGRDPGASKAPTEAEATRAQTAGRPMSFDEEKRSVTAVGTAAGEVVGAVVGAGAGPVGAVAGMVIGALAGHIAASAMEEEGHRVAVHDAELDDAIGVTRGTIGRGNAKRAPPDAAVFGQSKGSSKRSKGSADKA